ncbi:hypothetical protein Q649_00010 [Bartonella quintana JK 73]|uniref:Uncharacterized protein n=2 Tax=Bartonella quintana TaxID=803 RepID=W3U182_BARQI|nr:hypothetical protein Q651_00906 [Bartonella quintana BQ2-D70]ETS15138.1 hypothetical protein Q650_00010 [Bartonella quintana JK 73rel]ETS17430.1 hypothetical protein Q649_00010 [Bartonella quintana JK 73]KEC61043.1 hypothetical protein O91_00882 [Bartonella quintana JK 31]KEC64278.1 hypothetical protein O7Y_00035 [Bartonella quintana JK 63]KEC64758.1 hypothetical protein O7U_01230 [Bartonella quintana JK 68]KEC64854.1 hypothetical protein O7W_00590 [Bartonella quintana JK 56]KEC66701.1 hy
MVSEGFIVFAFAMEDFLRCLFLLKNSKKETSLGYQEVLIVRLRSIFGWCYWAIYQRINIVFFA